MSRPRSKAAATSVGTPQPLDDLHGSGLASAVGPEDAEDLTLSLVVHDEDRRRAATPTSPSRPELAVVYG